MGSQMWVAVAERVSSATRRKQQERHAAPTVAMLVLNAANSLTRSSAAQVGKVASQMLVDDAGRVSFALRRKQQERHAAPTVVMPVLNAANSLTRSSAALEGRVASRMWVAVAGRVSSATPPLWSKRLFPVCQ